MKKAQSFIKATLLVCTLVVLGLGLAPAPADAARGDITIFCSGSDLCATYEDDNVIIDFYLGRAVAVLIEL